MAELGNSRGLLGSVCVDLSFNALIRIWAGFKGGGDIEPASIVICIHPSARMADKLGKDEKTRIAAQVGCLGSESLKIAGWKRQKLDTKRPFLLITSFPMSDVKSIFRCQVSKSQVSVGISSTGLRQVRHCRSASTTMGNMIM